VSYKLNNGSVNGPVFNDFLDNVDETECKLLLDNAAIHHATKSCETTGRKSISTLAGEKNIELVYLPKYSPQLNPTELCFGIIKRSIEKKRPSTFEELEEAIATCLDRIKESIRNCFLKCLTPATAQMEAS
jgi:transposase